MMWLGLKRNKLNAEIYHKGEYIMTIAVSEQNRSNMAYITLTNCKDIKFKIIKDNESQLITDETIFNREEFNK